MVPGLVVGKATTVIVSLVINLPVIFPSPPFNRLRLFIYSNHF